MINHLIVTKISDYDLLVITGPTASGKTSLSVAMANELDGEVISADSRQVYRGMDIGTGKDLGEYDIDGKKVPYHLIDIVEPGYKYNVFEYQRDFFRIYEELNKRNAFPVVCGGSGMYADSIISGYKMFEVPPDSGLRAELTKKSMAELKGILITYKNIHNITDFDTRKRLIRAIEIEHFSKNRKKTGSKFPRLNPLIIGINIDRESRRRRISERLKERMDAGMIDEVKELIENGVRSETLIYYGLEYKFITLYLLGRMTYDEMFTGLETAIHQFAKRQMTWFRGMERKGTTINWIDGMLPLREKVDIVLGLLAGKQK
jgi:tRNA dimethylallyltransferase